MAVTTIKSTYSLDVESVRAGGVGTPLGGAEVRSVAAGPPRERGRLARTLFLQTASHPRPLPCQAHQTRLCGVLFNRARSCAGETPAFPGGLVRAGRPRSRGVLCGRDARVPGGSCAGGTPAFPGGLLCRPQPKRGSRSRSWRSLGASRSLADRMGCRIGHSIPISGSSQRMAIWSSAS